MRRKGVSPFLPVDPGNAYVLELLSGILILKLRFSLSLVAWEFEDCGIRGRRSGKNTGHVFFLVNAATLMRAKECSML